MTTDASRARGASWSITLQTPRILWFGMLMASFIYGGLIAAHLVPPAGGTAVPWLWPVLAGVGAVASFAYPQLFRRRRGPLSIETRDEIDQSANVMFRDAAPTRRVVANPIEARGKLAAREMTPFILELALSESVAVMGLLAWMVGGLSFYPSIALTVLGSLLIVLRYPSETRWRARGEALFNAHFPD